MWMLPPDADRLPRTGEGPEDLWRRSVPLTATPAEAYLERRRVPLAIAVAAGVRFSADLNGRPAVLARLTGPEGDPRAVHGRHLHNQRGEGKMFTVGSSGGVFLAGGFSGADGLRADPLILVEGLFDALSLAVAGLPCVATIGRWVDWLPELARGREVWLAFDGNRPGERSARGFAASLGGSRCLRLRPPGGVGDWNAAARKIGATSLARWLQKNAATALEEIA
jgi:hypothetical protein